MLAAGTDTISITLAWNFAIMCSYPDVQKRVSQEIDEFIQTHGRLPQFEERKELPLCISTIKECMRFKPILGFGLAHTTIKDRKYNIKTHIRVLLCIC
jgi:cytochrome P450